MSSLNSIKYSAKVLQVMNYILEALFIILLFIFFTFLLVQIPPFDIYKDSLLANYTEIAYLVLSILLAISNFFIHFNKFDQNMSNLILVSEKFVTYTGSTIFGLIQGFFQFLGTLITDTYTILGLGTGKFDLSSCKELDSNIFSHPTCNAIFNASNPNNFGLSDNNLSNNLAASKYIIINQYDLSSLSYSLGIYVDVIGIGQNVTFSAVFQITLLGTGNVGPFGILFVVTGSIPFFGTLTIPAIKISLVKIFLDPIAEYSNSLGNWYSIYKRLQAV